MTLTPFQKTELEKSAIEAGFDRSAMVVGGWLVVRSSHFAEPVELSRESDGGIVARLQPAIRSRDLMELAGVEPATLEVGAGVFGKDANAVRVKGTLALSALLEFIAREAMERRDNPLAIFRAKTRGLPAATEVERLTIQRIGQDVFRASLIEYWNGKCAITGCAIETLLRASHIKPWAKCVSDEERLDSDNGLLLSPAWDAAFDCGLVSFSDDGASILSPLLSENDRTVLGLTEAARTVKRLVGHGKYLGYHRQHVFQATGTAQA